MTVQPAKYYLPKGVFLCVVEASVVFLDLHNDKYISLEPEKTTALISLLSIRPEELHASTLSMFKRNAVNQNRESDKENCHIVEVAEDLITHNLLTTDPAAGVEENLTTIDIPPLDLSGYEFGKTPIIKSGHIFRFFMACSAASFNLRFFSIEEVVRSVKKARNGQQKSSPSDLDKIRDLVEIYNILKPLFFTTKNHCLFDSLTLIKFMALYDIYPTWVFGVKMGPFIAHCWVQDDNFIYNEALDNAHNFTPIMAV